MTLTIFRILFLFACLFGSVCGTCEEPSSEKKEEQESKKDKRDVQEISRTAHTLNLDGNALEYDAICGMLPLNSSDEKTEARIFYTAYVKKQADESGSNRPLLFCFNGGPGSSSVWLHMGLLGPKKVHLIDLAPTPPPSSYEDNPYTLLDIADIVFIDPVSTGFSKQASGVDAKQFHSVEGDIEATAEFIRLFLSHYQRWGSKRYLLGESYGTLRAVGLASYLHDNCFFDMNGIMMVSMCLDFQAYDFGNGNDLPYILALPSYAACAWYHKKLPQDKQKMTLEELLAEVEDFAMHDYATGLILGDSLDDDTKDDIASRLVAYTGLSKEFITRSHLRILNLNFYHELLKDESKLLGRFDSRFASFDSNHLEEPMIIPDPSFDAVTGPFTSAFNQYLSADLKVEKTSPYYILNANAVFPWNFTVDKIPAGLGYVYFSGKLRALLEKSPTLKVFVASGIYDLATPYFAANYTLNHLKLDPSLSKNITVKMYGAGHMMYLNPQSHAAMKQDLTAFLKN